MSNQTLSELMSSAGIDDMQAQSIMAAAVDNLGPAIMAGMGSVDVDTIDASEVVLVSLLIDDSSSISYSHNAQFVRDGHNLVINSLKGAKQAAEVLVSCRYLNGEQLYPYVALDDTLAMDDSNYRPNGRTPLFDQTVMTLTAATAKASDFLSSGVPVRSIVVVITDGADYGSQCNNAADVKSVLQAILRKEDPPTIFAAVGIDDGETNFRQVFGKMGVLDNWILTPGNTPQEIRRTFQTISQSVVRASQTAGSFSQAALGGFGN